MNSSDKLLHHLLELIQYNSHCNQKVIELITTNHNTCPEKAVLLLNHTLNAHHIWNARINDTSNKFGVWEIHAAEQLQQIDEENKTNTEIILSKSQLTSTITYQNMKGETFSNSFIDILFHVINHSTYHRGQIQSELKNSGIVPASLDYIFYKRTAL